jgi:hypothetical protein
MGLLDIFGGGGDTTSGDAALYGGLLNEAQLAALNDRKWASLAGALAEAGMPSRLPVPIGSAIGQAAKAWSGAGDEGALKVLQIQKLAAETTNLKELAALRKTMSAEDKPLFDAITGALRSGAGGVPGAGPLATTAVGGAPVAGPGGGSTIPAPTGKGGVTLAEAKAAALRAGFDENGANTIAAITVPESSLNPNAYNPNDPHGGSYGLTQINGVHPGAREALGNVDRAMELAYKVSNNGTNFRPWSTYTSGAYKPYLAEAAALRVGADAPGGGAPAAGAPLPPAFNLPNFSGAGGLLAVPTDATPAQESGWANAVPDKFIYGRNNPKPQGPFYGEPGYQPPPQVAAAASGGGGGPVIPPGAGGDVEDGAPPVVAPAPGGGLVQGLTPGQGPLAIPRPAGLPPMPPPQAAAPPVMQGPLAAPPPAPAVAPAGPGPLAAPAAPRPGPSYMPQMPGGDNQQLMLAQALIARQRMRAALAGISGDPYGGYADLLKNSPAALRQAELIKQQAEYYGPNANPPLQGAIAGSRAQAETPEINTRERFKTDEQIRQATAQAALNEQLKTLEQNRAAQLDFKEETVQTPDGRYETRLVPKYQIGKRFNPNIDVPGYSPGLDAAPAPSPTAPAGPAAPGVGSAPAAAVPPSAPPQGSLVLPKPDDGYEWYPTPQGPAQRPIPGGKVDEAQRKLKQFNAQSGNVVKEEVDQAINLLDRGSVGTTGALHPLARLYSQSDAAQLEKHINGILPNVGFDRLSAMRQTSPSGAAVGRLTEQEGKKLEAIAGSLDPTQRPDVLRRNFLRLHNMYIDTIHGSAEERARLVKDGKISQELSDTVDKMYYRTPDIPRPKGTADPAGAAAAAGGLVVKELNGKRYFSPDGGKTWY